MNEFDALQEHLNQYDPDLFLGRLCWFSITEQSRVDHGDFCKALMSSGLMSHLPPAPRPSDVFKRSCTQNQRKRVPTTDPKIFVNYLIREVGKDADNIWRILLAEQVDTDGHKLGHNQLYELHFHRPTSVIKATEINGYKPGSDAEADGIVAGVKSAFQVWNNMLTPYAIRELVRKVLDGMSATVVRPSGGVYFIREDHAAKIDAMESVISGLPGGSSFHSLPLVDDSKQRGMLKQAFEDESIGEVDRLLGEISEIMKSGQQISSDRFSDFKVEYDRLLKKVADYSDLLDEAMESTASRLEVMNEVLFTLLGRIRI